MAIALAGAATVSGSTAAGTTGSYTATPTAPSGVAVGDFLLLSLDTQSSTNPATAATPTGWTLIKSATSGQLSYLWYRFATAADTTATSYSISCSGGTSGATHSWGAAIQRLTGVDPTTPIDVAAVSAGTGYTGSTTTQTVTLPSITTATVGALELAYLSRDDSYGTPGTLPTGFTVTYTGSTASMAFRMAHQTRATAGATGTSVWSWTGSWSGANLQGIHVALRPAAGVTSGTASAAVGGGGSLVGGLLPRVAAGAALGGIGSLGTTQGTGSPAVAALSGSGSLATTRGSGIAVNLAGAGSVVGVASQTGRVAQGSLGGSGTLASSRTPALLVVTSLSGAGSLSSSRTAVLRALASLSGSGAVMGSGAAVIQSAAVALLVSSGGLVVPSVKSGWHGTALLTSSGTLTAMVDGYVEVSDGVRWVAVLPQTSDGLMWTPVRVGTVG